MVDVDRRITGLNPAHVAGLRRLSARAAAPPTVSVRNSLLSFSTLANTVISHLQSSNIRVLPGLTETEFARTEAEFGFTFPPDLRAVLSLGLPTGPGFPNWRADASSRAHLRALLYIPIASISSQIVRNSFWLKSWGSRPAEASKALGIARNHLKKATLLIPLFNHCYIPCTPCLAGNPIFFIDKNQIFCCGCELDDFFERQSTKFLFQSTDLSRIQRSMTMSDNSISSATGLSRTRSESKSTRLRIPRWVEFWSEAASNSRRSSVSADPCFEICDDDPVTYRNGLPVWVEEYLSRTGFFLKQSGWDENDISDILNVPGGDFLEQVIYFDTRAVLDSLVLEMDRLSGLLRNAGWSCEEVSDALCFDFWVGKERKHTT